MGHRPRLPRAWRRQETLVGKTRVSLPGANSWENKRREEAAPTLPRRTGHPDRTAPRRSVLTGGSQCPLPCLSPLPPASARTGRGHEEEGTDASPSSSRSLPITNSFSKMVSQPGPQHTPFWLRARPQPHLSVGRSGPTPLLCALCSALGLQAASLWAAAQTLMFI